MLSKAFLPLLFAAVASAHTIFQELHVNGVSQGHKVGIRYPNYNGPITDVTSNDIICNGGPNPLVTPYSNTIINVPAGATLTAEWHHDITGANPSDASDPVDPTHKGPIMAYLAKVDSALQTSVTGLKWFKIWEDGLGSDGKWAVDKLIANKGKVSFPVPSCIPPGNYFLRVELVALHGAGSYPGAQFYMECAQINITYLVTGTDPGITISIYYPPVTNYIIPGPRPFTCGGSNTSVTPTSSTSSRVSSSTSSSRSSSTSSRASTTSSAATGSQTLYGQCGGQGWTGPTTCASGTCKVSNQFYSQCLP
ncbi:related to cel1 protein precursor [Serendipita indica DSM 11827]|uniref:AA9 family lytic polysaccharide monooxygenase n=1 Tax=Serendipita indica (strain DSM 11827) TaxID=1109443 RepID=G4T8M3_SERID|nr:related to cel1 protein precursor [Serendipita indica DSM 11827]